MIDWEKQWEQFAPGFTKGELVVELGSSSISLLPGPGFGDLSHPTTQMMMDLLPKYVRKERVFDVGCGSGILSLAAKALGAGEVFGIDIDPLAVTHAEKNAQHNGLEVQFSLPQTPPFTEGVLLMNMISSEQKRAWEKIPKFEGTYLISGLLEEQVEEILAWYQPKQLLEEVTLEGWSAMTLLK